MTLCLDPVRRIGGLRLWVLSEQSAAGHRLTGGLAFAGSKRPVAIVIDDGKDTAAFAPGGQRILADELARRFPDLANRIATARAQERG